MNKPEQEILFAVLEETQKSTLERRVYQGFMGHMTVYASESNGKLYINLQKWPKKDKPLDQVQEDPNTFKSTEEDVPY
jgi:hypothetical protein